MSDITIPTNSDIYKTGLNPTEDIYAESTAHMGYSTKRDEPVIQPPAKRLTAPAANGLPSMPETSGVIAYSAGVPSIGASVLALITEYAGEERSESHEQRYLSAQATAEKIHEQADKMRDQAVVNLCLGLMSAAVSVATSVYTLKSSMKIDAQAQTLEGDARTDFLKRENLKLDAKTSTMKAGGSVLDAIAKMADSFMSAEIKDMDAQIEMMRQNTESLKSLEEALKEVISKALSTQQAIEENVNQTRTRILS